MEATLWDNVMKLRGRVKAWLNGKLIAEGDNLVVSAGNNYAAQRIGSSATAMSHMAIGNGGDASTAAMNVLQGSELERVALTSVSVNANVITYSATFGSGIGSPQTVREFGIFNDSVAGDMLCRFIASGFLLSPGESLLVEWSVTVGD
jgi:hypothetical protein